jgi:hypothetical protein
VTTESLIPPFIGAPVQRREDPAFYFSMISARRSTRSTTRLE